MVVFDDVHHVLSSSIPAEQPRTREIFACSIGNVGTSGHSSRRTAASSMIRTEKFLCATASSPFVLTEGWVNLSVRSGKLLLETAFLISDPESEWKWTFKLSTSLERAKREDAGDSLLKGMSFYVTPKVEIDLKLLKAVIASAGGQVQTSKPTTRILKGNKNRHVISCPADQSIWRPLVEEGYTIYSRAHFASPSEETISLAKETVVSFVPSQDI
ncbi:hypothetical protein F4604DRAFT_2043514 [Suillus subluteus]|nr:hypothetical protein F4604DRAFT_2043514 [Suillus subluteus]